MAIPTDCDPCPFPCRYPECRKRSDALQTLADIDRDLIDERENRRERIGADND